MKNRYPTNSHDTATMSVEELGQLQTGMADFKAWVQAVTRETGSYNRDKDGVTVFAHAADGALVAGITIKDDDGPGYRSLKVYSIAPEDRWLILQDEDNYTDEADGGHWKLQGDVSIDPTEAGYVVNGTGYYEHVGLSDETWSQDGLARTVVGLLGAFSVASEEA